MSVLCIALKSTTKTMNLEEMQILINREESNIRQLLNWKKLRKSKMNAMILKNVNKSIEKDYVQSLTRLRKAIRVKFCNMENY